MLFMSSFWNINLLAVLAAGIAHLLTGLVWFSPRLFGIEWMQLTGKDLKPASQWMIAGVFGHLGIALVMAFLVNLAGATTILEGIAVGVLIWAGFIVTLEIGELIWEKISFRLFILRIGNHLVALSIVGAILAFWQ